MPKQAMKVNYEGTEMEVRFTRRRYGRKTFTWGEVKMGEDCWVDLWYGDAIPSVSVTKQEILSGIAEIFQREEVPHPSQQLSNFL